MLVNYNSYFIFCVRIKCSYNRPRLESEIHSIAHLFIKSIITPSIPLPYSHSPSSPHRPPQFLASGYLQHHVYKPPSPQRLEPVARRRPCRRPAQQKAGLDYRWFLCFVSFR